MGLERRAAKKTLWSAAHPLEKRYPVTRVALTTFT